MKGVEKRRLLLTKLEIGLDRQKREPGEIPVHASRNRRLAGAPWGQTEESKAETKALKPSEIKPPRCPHGVQLTPEEWEGNNYAFERLKQKDKPTSFETVLLRSSTCLRCNPVCNHGQPMNKEEVKEARTSGKRFSLACAACTRSESLEDWDRVLKHYGLPASRGMSPAKHVISKPDGSTHILGQQKNFQTGGDIEARDVASTIARDDVPARSRKPQGHGIDGAGDHGQIPNSDGLTHLDEPECEELPDVDESKEEFERDPQHNED